MVLCLTTHVHGIRGHDREKKDLLIIIRNMQSFHELSWWFLLYLSIPSETQTLETATSQQVQWLHHFVLSLLLISIIIPSRIYLFINYRTMMMMIMTKDPISSPVMTSQSMLPHRLSQYRDEEVEEEQVQEEEEARRWQKLLFMSVSTFTRTWINCLLPALGIYTSKW